MLPLVMHHIRDYVATSPIYKTISIQLVTAIKHPHMCHVCGKPAYSKCGLCDVTLHYFLKRGAHAWAECFLQYHSDTFFGLAKSDAIIVKKRKQDWVFPTNSAKQGNAAYIR